MQIRQWLSYITTKLKTNVAKLSSFSIEDNINIGLLLICSCFTDVQRDCVSERFHPCAICFFVMGNDRVVL